MPMAQSHYRFATLQLPPRNLFVFSHLSALFSYATAVMTARHRGSDSFLTFLTAVQSAVRLSSARVSRQVSAGPDHGSMRRWRGARSATITPLTRLHVDS